jgi:hypothetical protein
MPTTTKPRTKPRTKSRAKPRATLLHEVVVGQPLRTMVEGHTARKDSRQFIAARAAMHKILKTFTPNPWGSGKDVQAHHGGSIWLYTGEQNNPWRVVINWAGIEWSTQFCCDPAKIDLLRQNAVAITQGFPRTIPELKKLGYKDTDILMTPVTDPAGIAKYVDSIWNSCVPIPQPQHTGAVKPGKLLAAGVHTYPEPACAIERVMRSDFVPYVIDSATKTTAIVVPVAPRHSGDGRVRVIFAEKGHPLRGLHTRARDQGEALVLAPESPIARRAFVHQR